MPKEGRKVCNLCNSRSRIREKNTRHSEKRNGTNNSPEFRSSIVQHLKPSFLRGLNKEIIITKEKTFEEIESRAIEAERELDTVNMIRRIVLAEDDPA